MHSSHADKTARSGSKTAPSKEPKYEADSGKQTQFLLLLVAPQLAHRRLHAGIYPEDKHREGDNSREHQKRGIPPLLKSSVCEEENQCTDRPHSKLGNIACEHHGRDVDSRDDEWITERPFRGKQEQEGEEDTHDGVQKGREGRQEEGGAAMLIRVGERNGGKEKCDGSENVERADPTMHSHEVVTVLPAENEPHDSAHGVQRKQEARGLPRGVQGKRKVAVGILRHDLPGQRNVRCIRIAPIREE